MGVSDGPVAAVESTKADLAAQALHGGRRQADLEPDPIGDPPPGSTQAVTQSWTSTGVRFGDR